MSNPNFPPPKELQKYPAVSDRGTVYNFETETYHHPQPRTPWGLYWGSVLILSLVLVTLILIAYNRIIVPEQEYQQQEDAQSNLPVYLQTRTATPTPTASPTQTPFVSSTPDFNATEAVLDQERKDIDLTRTAIVLYEQDQARRKINNADLQAALNELEISNTDLEMARLTLTLAIPLATQNTEGTKTQQAAELEILKTQSALDAQERQNVIETKKMFWDGLRILGLIVSYTIIFSLTGFLMYLIYKQIMSHEKRTALENIVDETAAEEEGRVIGEEMGTATANLHSFIREAIQINGEHSNIIPGHRDMPNYDYNDKSWTKNINLLKLHNRVYKGGKGGRQYLLRRGSLTKLLTEIENGEFPPPNSGSYS